MIRSFTIGNFCSFQPPATVSFVVGRSAPENTAFRDSLVPEERLSTLIGVFGPNASGKTNLLKGLSFISWFLLHSYEANPDETLPVDGFRPLGPDEPTRVEIEYETAGTLFRYKAEITATAVLSETLSRRGETGRFSAVLQRQSAGPSEKPAIAIHDDLDIPKGVLQNTLRPNASIVSTALQTGNEALRRWTYALSGAGNVHRFGRASQVSEAQLLRSAIQIFHRDQDLFSRMHDLVQRGDLGIKQLDITEETVIDEEKGAMRKELVAEVTHTAGDLPDFSLPLLLESSGTKRLFILLSWLLPALRDGRPAIIDELESDLHPHMLPWILRLFTNPENNLHGAQLLFTCHTVETMNRLDKTQIVLVEKSAEDNVSEAWRLDEIRGVRRDDNLFAKYNAGSYGAVPEPH